LHRDNDLREFALIALAIVEAVWCNSRSFR
jgi:hypothetical protein